MAPRRAGMAAPASPVPPGSPGRRMAGPPSPAAARSTRLRWGDPRLALGLGLIGLCCLLGARTLAAAEDTVGVWAAVGALEPGQQVAAQDLVRREVRFGGQADADRYVSVDSRLPADATVDRPVGAGELLPRSALVGAGSDSVTEVPMAVRAEAVPVSVRVGSTVDVWVTPKSATTGTGRPGGRSTLVFDDVPVTSAPDSPTSMGPTGARQVTVGVAAGESSRLPRLIAALAGGDVTLTLQR